MIQINGRKHASSWVALCLQQVRPTVVLFKNFMTHANGRCTPIEKEKIRLEQDVSFGTLDIDMHRFTFTILFEWSCIFKALVHIFIKHACFVLF